MKRYWLFEAPQYYASGGMLDWKGDYDTVEEAEDARSAKFTVPEISQKDIEKMWEDEQRKGIAPEKFIEVRNKYRKMSCLVSDAHEMMETGYHILDTQDRVIVQGWDQYEKEPIGKMLLSKFK